MTHDRFHQRITTANHYDNHAINETHGEEISVEVQTPLSAILSIHLDPARYAKLKRLAKSAACQSPQPQRQSSLKP